MIELDDFNKLEPGTERRVPNLEILDEFYFGKDFDSRFFFSYRGKFKNIEKKLSTEAMKIEIIEEKSGFSQLRFILRDQILEVLFVKIMYNFIDEITPCDETYTDDDKLLMIFFYILATRKGLEKYFNKTLTKKAEKKWKQLEIYCQQS